MLSAGLIAVPLLFAVAAFFWPNARQRAWLLPVAAAAHLAMSLAAVATDAEGFAGWLGFDPVAKLLLVAVSVLFAASSIYAPGYLALKPHKEQRVFVACILALLGMMTTIIEAQHLGLMWVALEACTLATAPLLLFHKNARSLEALWKYLLVGSVGIAIAFLGTLFLAYSALHAGERPVLVLGDLVAVAPRLSRPWLHSAFVLLFIGYGTKMGLAPMHTWKPDAYGEASGLVGTLLAGGLSSAGFLAIVRFQKILVAAGDGAFGRQIMVVAGIASIAVAAAFMARLRDIKRLLAYSSVEHMGILVLGVGIGGGAVLGSMLHMVNNALVKGVMFLAAGNIHRVYGARRVAAHAHADVDAHAEADTRGDAHAEAGAHGEAHAHGEAGAHSAADAHAEADADTHADATAGHPPRDVSGVLRRMPATGALFVLGFFAVTGSPPFGTFVSEFSIVRGAFASGRIGVGIALVALLFVVFISMGTTVFAAVHGPAPSHLPRERRDTVLTVAPLVGLIALVLLFGVYIPEPIQSAFTDAANWLEAP